MYNYILNIFEEFKITMFRTYIACNDFINQGGNIFFNQGGSIKLVLIVLLWLRSLFYELFLVKQFKAEGLICINLWITAAGLMLSSPFSSSYINGHFITILGISFLMEAISKTLKVCLHIAQKINWGWGLSGSYGLIYPSILVTVGIYLFISCDIDLYSNYEILLCLCIGAIITRLIYKMSLNLYTHIKMRFYVTIHEDVSIIASILLYIMHLILHLYSYNFTLDFLYTIYVNWEYYSDFGIINCEGNQPPSNENPTPNSEGSNNNNNNGKKPKPNLHIDIGPKTDVDKDNVKIGNCEHEKLVPFRVSEEKEVEETSCDFSQDVDPNGKPETHRAFDSVTDVALLCQNCHAIVCKNCIEDYSSSENTPIN